MWWTSHVLEGGMGRRVPCIICEVSSLKDVVFGTTKGVLFIDVCMYVLIPESHTNPGHTLD